jgi:hypothetical protein
MVLVTEDPLKDIAGASKIAGVLVRGRWVDAAEILKRMKEIAAPARSAGLN